MRFQTLYEGRYFLVPSLFATIFGAWLAMDWSGWLWLCIPSALVFIFCANFFRDPERRVAGGPEIVVSPADGVVDAIESVEETEVLGRTCRRVSIFLNVFDVHVNRAPIEGDVTYSKHHPGTYLDARDPYCHQRNEALTWAFAGDHITIVVRQITGAIARRIVAWKSVEDPILKGERFGMIRFGSRTDIYLPVDAGVLVKIGDRVEGSATALARLAQPYPKYVISSALPAVLLT